MKRAPAFQRYRAFHASNSGFTLVEVLVTITIIIVLAALSFIGVTRMRFSAAKATTVSQMRQIGIAALTWGSEKNNGEPFYVANGSGDYCDESFTGPNPALSPGNPAKLLYARETPEQGYITDHHPFFSSLVKTTPPDRANYKPEEAGGVNKWGTFVWYYPFSTTPTAKQSSASGQWLGAVKVHPRLENKLLMMTDYSKGDAVWEKYYLALLIDGTVRPLDANEVPTRPSP